MAKPKPEKVHPGKARQAASLAPNNPQGAYSQYIKITFRQTGNLAPGCDARDLMQWYRENMPEYIGDKK